MLHRERTLPIRSATTAYILLNFNVKGIILKTTKLISIHN